MQPLHRLKLEWSSALSLEIEWVGGQPGRSVFPSVPLDRLVACEEEVALDPLGKLGLPPLCWRPEGESLFAPLQLRENTEYLIDATIPGDLESAIARAAGDRTWPLSSRLATFYRSDPPKRWQRVDGGVRVTGRLNFGSYVGLADLALPNSGPVVVEVVCAKIGYFGDFRTLLDQIAEEFVGLLFEVDAPTYAPFSLADNDEVDPAVLLFHVRRLMSEGQLPLAMEMILQSPQNVLETTEELVPLNRVRNPAPDRIVSTAARMAFDRGGPLALLFGGYTPELLPDRSTRETFDTAENRYVKAFLEDLLQRVETLTLRLGLAGKGTSAREAASWAMALSDWLAQALWRDVGPMTHFPSNSQVLQRRQGYRDVLEADLSLQFGLRLPWSRGAEIADGLDGDIRPISELYEYWCFFMLRGVLRALCGPENVGRSSLMRTSDGGFSLDLRKGTASKLAFDYRRAPGPAMGVSLFYNRTFRRNEEGSGAWDGSYSAGFHPDYSILIEVPRADTAARVTRHWLHFDAKYRLDIRQWHAEIEDTTEAVEVDIEQDLLGQAKSLDADQKDTFKRGDLYKMHTYRDALLGSRGAYILFPGSSEREEIYIRHPGTRYPQASPYVPGVGAFQLRPSNNGEQVSNLGVFIAAVLEQLTGAGTTSYLEEQGLFLPLP